MFGEDVTGGTVAVSGGSIEVAGATEQGPVRVENQDVWSHAVTVGATAGVILLADGMGGERGGLEAARAAVDAGRAAVVASGEEAVVASVARASSAAVDRVRAELGGHPGTTLVMAVLSARALSIAHAGDSRAYLLRGGSIQRLTVDHTRAAEEEAAGRITETAARHDARRNVITRAVTGDPLELEVVHLPRELGDVVVLCSDGLWEPLTDGEIAHCFPPAQPLSTGVVDACRRALAAGASDNVTVAAATFHAGTVTK